MSAIGSGTPFKWPTDDDLTLVIQIRQPNDKNEKQADSSVIQKPDPKLPDGGINYCW